MAKEQKKMFKEASLSAAQGGGPQLAERKLVEEIKKHPKNVKALFLLSSLYIEKNELFPAVSLLQRAVSIAPSSTLLVELSIVYRKLARLDLALPVLEKAMALDGNNSKVLFNYGGVLNDLGKLEEALKFFRLASEKDGAARAPALAAAAVVKEKMGRVDEAFAEIMTLVEQGHKSPLLLISLGNILQQHAKFSENIDLCISLLVEAFAKKTIRPCEANSFYYLLGHLYQKRKDYDSAFISFEKGHEHTNQSYNEDYEVAVVERIYQSWSTVERSTLAVNSPAKQQLFFIVGMPRSGSTLVEQILSVYPESVDLGEEGFFSLALGEFFASTPGDFVVAGSRPLAPEEARTIRSLYMQQAFHSRRPAAVVIDKTLSNTMHVGQILQVYPNAKILWTRRDPRDACLSCYTFDFTGSHPYRHDQRTLARYHNRVEKLMRFWQERYPESVYAVEYEEMILNPEKGIRELIDFCDLPWSDDYLRFHQVKRKVTTASYNQVTQPIYTSAIGRWKVYEKHLGPLLEELDLPN